MSWWLVNEQRSAELATIIPRVYPANSLYNAFLLFFWLKNVTIKLILTFFSFSSFVERKCYIFVDVIINFETSGSKIIQANDGCH